MSTLSQQRNRIYRSTDWLVYRQQRAHLAELFPAIAPSGRAKLPLAVGIKYDLIGANTGLSPTDIKHFLRAYTFGPKYLRQLKAGARRFDLAGLVVGSVSDDDADFAALCLRTHYEMKRTGRAGLTAVRDALQDDEPAYAYRFARRAA
jgi:sRNA-binding protein